MDFDALVLSAKKSLESIDTDISKHSVVFSNTDGKEWAIYMHMKVHMSMDSPVEAAPCLLVNPSDVGEEDNGKTPRVIRTFPPRLLPGLEDIRIYLKDRGNLVEDAVAVGNTDAKRLLVRWLNVCTACARNKSRHLCYLPTTMYKLTQSKYASDAEKPHAMQSTYARMFRWDTYTLPEVDVPILLAFDASWGNYGNAPIVHVYWRAFSSGGSGTSFEDKVLAEIEAYAREEAKKMCFLPEDHEELMIVDVVNMHDTVRTLTDFIVCISVAESLPRDYDPLDVRHIYRTIVQKAMPTEEEDFQDKQRRAMLCLLYHNDPLVSLTSSELSAATRPPVVYSPMFGMDRFVDLMTAS